MQEDKCFAGIGSRKAPTSIIPLIAKLGESLYQKGYILRSGGAMGSDLFWENSYKGKKEIYRSNDVCQNALDLAKSVHPNWNICNEFARRLHARNCYQILGRKLDTPSELVICWTPDGKLVGGTAQAMRLAKKYNIPIFNLAISSDIDVLEIFIENIGLFH